MSNSTPNSPDFQQSRAPHLLEEPPILVYPTLAVYMGINKAVVFQQLHFLQNGQKTAKNEHNYIDGRYWVYNSYQQWKDQYFPWLSVSTLKGIFIELEDDDKLIMSRQSVKNKSDRRKWYSIDYEAWVSFCTTMRQKMSYGSSDKISPMVGQEMSDGYSEITSKKTETTSTVEQKPKPKAQPNPILGRWKQVAQIGDELLKVFKNDFVPVENQTTAAIEPYLIVAEDFTRIGAPVEHIAPLHRYIVDRAERENWATFSVKVMPKYYTEYLKTKQKPTESRKQANIIQFEEKTPEEREALAEARKNIRPDWKRPVDDEEAAS